MSSCLHRLVAENQKTKLNNGSVGMIFWRLCYFHFWRTTWLIICICKVGKLLIQRRHHGWKRLGSHWFKRLLKFKFFCLQFTLTKLSLPLSNSCRTSRISETANNFPTFLVCVLCINIKLIISINKVQFLLLM